MRIASVEIIGSPTGVGRQRVENSFVTATTVIAGVDVEPIVDGYATFDPEDILVPSPQAGSTWRAEWFNGGAWTMPIGGFVIRRDGRLALIDAGLGPRCTGPHNTGRMLEHLNALGVAPEAVTDVIITHLHLDHVGWVSRDGTPTFPNAVHHWHHDDWVHVLSGPDTASDSVLRRLSPATDLLRLAQGEREEILSGVTLRLLPGHTPGNCLIEVASGDEQVYLLGDTAHHPSMLVETGWTDHYDADPVRGQRVRAELAEELERTGIPVVGAHFDQGRFGRVIRGRDGRRHWRPL